MSIDTPDLIAKPSKRWWFKIRLELARWFRTEVEAESQSFDRGRDLPKSPVEKALPPP
jgi:hypothetical protein